MRALPITRKSSVDPDQRIISGLTCISGPSVQTAFSENGYFH